MAVEKFEAPYGLIFNFSEYAGNFEREFCGYVVGAVGQCDVGREMADLFNEDHPEGTKFYAVSDRTVSEPDDRGCYRPVSIYNDPVDDEQYQSLIIFFDTRPDDDELEMFLERAKVFCKEKPHWQSYHGDPEKYPLVLKGMRLITNKVERVIKTEKTFDVS